MSFTIVVSNDEKTMTSKEAKKAYAIVNNKLELRTPTFTKFEEFKQAIKQ